MTWCQIVRVGELFVVATGIYSIPSRSSEKSVNPTHMTGVDVAAWRGHHTAPTLHDLHPMTYLIMIVAALSSLFRYLPMVSMHDITQALIKTKSLSLFHSLLTCIATPSFTDHE